MKRAAALLLLLSGTACIDTEVARPYRCTTPGAAEECTEGWICGLDLQCRAADAGTGYRCDLDAGVGCPREQLCGLEGRCRYANAEGDWLCVRASGFGCAPGWQCALNGRCRNRAAGGPFPCERVNDAGEDCGNQGNGGWRCGYGAAPVCQQIGTPDDYPCGNDSDCEGGWRCGLSGVCADPTLDDLVSHWSGAATAALVSPKLPGQTLMMSANVQAGGTFLPFGFTNFSDLTVLGEQGLHTIPLSAAPVSIVATDEGVFAITKANELVLLQNDGGTPPQSLPAGFVISGDTKLFGLATDLGGLLFVEPNELLVDERGDGVLKFSTPELLPADGGAKARLTGMVYGAGVRSAQPIENCLVVAYQSGLATAPQKSGGVEYQLQEMPDCVTPACDRTPNLFPPNVVDFRVLGDTLFAIRTQVPNSPGSDAIALFEVDWGPSCKMASTNVLLESCRADCGNGRLIDYRISYSAAGAGLELRCENPLVSGARASVRQLRRPGGGPCESTLLPTEDDPSAFYSDRVLIPYNAPSVGVASSPQGHMWLFPWLSARLPVVLDQQVLALVVPANSTDEVVLGADLSAKQSFVGYAPVPPKDVLGVDPISVVAGDRSLLITTQRQVVQVIKTADGGTGERLRGSLNVSAAAFERPIHGAVRGGDAGVLFTATVSDALLTAVPAMDGGIFAASVRLVPAPRSPITSFALSSESGPGVFARAWALTTAGVFELTAETATRWKSTPLSLPDIEPVEVWADGELGRVGMRDGRIFALKSRTQIAPAIIEGDQTLSVNDYETLCGEVFALTDRGVYRLQHGAPEGSWALQTALVTPLAASFQGFPPYFDARLVNAGDRLLVAFPGGVTAELDSGDCGASP